MSRVGYVLDGKNLACLGTTVARGERGADLRKVLVVAREIAYNDAAFVCYFDRGTPYGVREEDRDLLDLLCSQHAGAFRPVPANTVADDYLLQRANSDDAVVVSHDSFRRPQDYRERYPWLDEPGRHLRPMLEDDRINCPRLGVLEYRSLSAFDLYQDLLPFLV